MGAFPIGELQERRNRTTNSTHLSRQCLKRGVGSRMSLLCRLPDDLLASLISNYLTLVDIVNLDSSILNHHDRISLLSSYQFIQKIYSIESLNLIQTKWLTKNCYNLLKVFIIDSDILDSDLLEIFQYCYQMKELIISGGQYTNDGLCYILNQCIHLNSLHVLNNAFITSFTTLNITQQNMNHLKQIDLSGCSSAQDQMLFFISKYCQNILSLSLGNCWSLTNDGLISVIQNCRALEYLDLNQCSQFNDQSLSQIPQYLQRLKGLNFRNCVDVTGVSLLPITSSLVNLQNLNLSSCFRIPHQVYVQLALSLPMLTELRLCSIAEEVGLFFENIRILSTGCLRLQYLSLAGCSSVTDEVLSIFNDKTVFPNLKCLDFAEDDSSIFYPLPSYRISPELVDRISLLRYDPFSDSPFIRIDPMRFSCKQHEFDLMEDFDEIDDDDDVYDDILTYSQIPEYFSLSLPDDPQVSEDYEEDDDHEIDDWNP
jgi:hypothetical protein